MFLNMEIIEHEFGLILIEFQDENKKSKFYNILEKLNEEIRLFSKGEFTQGVWGSSFRPGPYSNFFNPSFRKRLTLFFAEKTPFLFNQIYQVKRLVSEFFFLLKFIQLKN